MNFEALAIAAIAFAIVGWLTRKSAIPKASTPPQPSNTELLNQSIDKVIEVLRLHNDTDWAERVASVKTKINTLATRAEGLEELSTFFGGMSSLNDADFPGVDFGSLLDDLFRNMNLINATPADRELWKQLEDQHKGELPPRLKHAFRE